MGNGENTPTGAILGIVISVLIVIGLIISLATDIKLFNMI